MTTHASMRPRLFTAENLVLAQIELVDGLASMRPRLFTAENPAGGQTATARGHASMRPRLFTAENAGDLDRQQEESRCFNEAAALHRGKRRWS